MKMMKKMVKSISFIVALVLLMGIMASCATETQPSATSTPAATQQATTAPTAVATATQSNFDTSKDITVISREDGSGTRSAFIELFGVQQKDASGKNVDMTTTEANITNSTEVMMTSVAGDKYAIGYISLGSLNDTVKALKIEGIDATVANIKNATYPVVRPFNIATKGTLDAASTDFIKFILSAQGQKIVSDNKYVTIDDSAAQYTTANASGKIVVAGSSSVTPLMEKLKEGYTALNPKVTIEVQQSDSTTGMTSAINGICQIGMASRELKDTEVQAGLKATVIAKDGIAVIVNKVNPATNMTKDLVKKIFTGDITSWNEAK